MNSKRTLMTQAEFARLVGRTQERVSQWILKGHISPAAIIGRKRKIWAEKAQEELALSLDTRRETLSRRGNSPSIARRRAAETHTAELRTELARHSMAVASGTIIPVDEFKRDCAKELSLLNADREYFLLNYLSKGLASTFNIDWRSASAEIRKHYRQFQAEVSAKALAEAE
jgi:hypothetical protein